ncbi:MAG: GrpB family protein [Aestuariivirga sp.]
MRKFEPIVIDEPVHLVEYSDRWPTQFNNERLRLVNLIQCSTDSIQHIGSTAVPRLSAKPIIDMMLGITEYSPQFSLIEKIVDAGYEDCGEAGLARRRYFRSRLDPNFNLHVVELEQKYWRENLALRSFLLKSPEARNRYMAAKLSAIESGNNTLLSYSNAKNDVVAALIEAALTEFSAF